MGRATILGGGADGLYVVQVDYGAARVSARIDKLTARLASLDQKITEATTDMEVAEAARLDTAQALSLAINAYLIEFAAGGKAEAERQAVLEATKADRLAIDKIDEAKRKLASLRFERMATSKEKDSLSNAVVFEEREAWCTTLTEDASGTVATIEIPGEPTYLLIGRDGVAPQATDGRLLAREAMTGPQAYFNAAILPGWQKWQPDYRTGVISEIDLEADTATVTLSDVRSTAQSLAVNQEEVLRGVPVEYLDCNAGAFENGDQVVVQFAGRDWSEPKVIGFLTNPKPCGFTGLYSIPANSSVIRGWGKPFTDGGGSPINPPLGTANGTANGVLAICSESDIDFLRRGLATDTNSSDATVYSEQKQQSKEWVSLDGTKVVVCKADGIYYRGKRRSLNPAGTVHTAAIYTVATIDWLWCCSLSGTTLKFWKKLLSAPESVDWTLIAEYELTTLDARFSRAPWEVLILLGSYWLSPPLVMRAICNGSGTYCLIYVGRPHVAPGETTPFWHGYLKIETKTGTVTAYETQVLTADRTTRTYGLTSSVTGPPAGEDRDWTTTITDTYVPERKEVIDVGWSGDDEVLFQIWASGSATATSHLVESVRPSSPSSETYVLTTDSSETATFYLTIGATDHVLGYVSGSDSLTTTGTYDPVLGYMVFEDVTSSSYSLTKHGIEYLDGPNQAFIVKRSVGTQTDGTYSGTTYLELKRAGDTYEITSASGDAVSVTTGVSMPPGPIVGQFADIDVPWDITTDSTFNVTANYSWYPWGPPPETFSLEWLAEKWANYRFLNGVLLGSFPLPQKDFTRTTGYVENRATNVDHLTWINTSNVENVESEVYELPAASGTRFKNIKLI